MNRIITTERVPIKIWTGDIEEGALVQAKNLANLPFVFKHIAIMPDCHQGYGMPIGGVMATRGVVVPNAVGVDIGCGMCAVKTSFKEIETETLKKIMSEIRRVVPVGFKKHKEMQPEHLMPEVTSEYVVTEHHNNARRSLGTLGGGNHFIEIQKDENGFVWIMIHSGSRNLGKQVADYYNKLAILLNERYFSEVVKDKQLAFLPLDSDEGQRYLKEMQYCVDFALANRKLIMDKTIYAFCKFLNNFYKTADIINIASYIVEGRGNPLSFNSCSHGAGRVLGRKQAQRELSLDKEIKRLESMGVIHSIRKESDLDEAPGAYKNISEVIENQKDLINIKKKLKPIAVIKG
jgi:tRNA-splicing ligase RtcB